MVIKSVNLETVCGITSTIPDNEYNEVAFAGKSNVGKSSLINALMNRKSLARISSQPGKTQTINFYNVNDAMYLVYLPGYGYANDYGFQYVFGTTTCLIYAAMINYAELKGKHKEFLPIFMSISALLFFSSLVGGNVGSKELYDNNRERYDIKDELIDSIPEDASVACDSFYLPHLAQRDRFICWTAMMWNRLPLRTSLLSALSRTRNGRIRKSASCKPKAMYTMTAVRI